MSVPAERVAVLEWAARAAADAGDVDRAREYVRLARRIAERNRLEFPRSFQRHACEGCDAYLLPGRTARVRTRSGHVVWTCRHCGTQARYPYADG